MKIPTISLTLLAALLALTGCDQKKSASDAVKEAGIDQVPADTFPLIAKKDRAASFDAVARRLDLGGDSFYFADFGTTFQQLGQKFGSLMQGMQGADPANMQFAMAAMLPYEQLVDVLGVSDLSALGMSSYYDGSLYRSKCVVYLPDGLHGLFTLIGTKPGSFDTLALAPADSDVFFTQQIHGSAIKQIILEGAEAIAPGNGDKMAAGLLSQPAGPALTVGEVLDKADTTFTAVVRLGEPREIAVPDSEASFSLPRAQFLFRLSGQGWLITDGIIPVEMSVSEGDMTRTEKNGLVIYRQSAEAAAETPSDFAQVQIILDSATGDLTIVSDDAFWQECTSGKTSLADSPRYQTAVKGLPAAGNSLTYVSKESFNTLISLYKQAQANVPPQIAGMLTLYELYLPILSLDKVEADAASVITADATSIFSDSRWPTSSGSMAGGSSGVVVTGLLAAMAIPAFNKVRAESREKTITNNLRLVASAGQQYMLENGVTEVSYDKLLQEQYYTPIQPVNGESYDDLVVREEGGILEVTTASGETVSYEY
jgi:type IV pilus assembly protein PilA